MHNEKPPLPPLNFMDFRERLLMYKDWVVGKMLKHRTAVIMLVVIAGLNVSYWLF